MGSIVINSVLSIARNEVGVREESQDWGDRVSDYLQSVGINFPAHWCAAFTYWCVKQGSSSDGFTNPVLRSSYCPDIHHWAKRESILYTIPKVGDIWLIYRTFSDGIYDAYHCGFVTDVSGASFGTIEGNTNIDGSSNGIGVFERRRHNSSNTKFVRWAELAKASTATYKLFLKQGDNEIEVADCPIINGRSWMPVRKVAERLGYQVDWNELRQSVLIDGEDLTSEIVIINGKGHCRVTEFANFVGMSLSVDNSSRKLTLSGNPRRF